MYNSKNTDNPSFFLQQRHSRVLPFRLRKIIEIDFLKVGNNSAIELYPSYQRSINQLSAKFRITKPKSALSSSSGRAKNTLNENFSLNNYSVPAASSKGSKTTSLVNPHSLIKFDTSVIAEELNLSTSDSNILKHADTTIKEVKETIYTFQEAKFAALGILSQLSIALSRTVLIPVSLSDYYFNKLVIDFSELSDQVQVTYKKWQTHHFPHYISNEHLIKINHPCNVPLTTTYSPFSSKDYLHDMSNKTFQPPILRYKTESIHPNIHFSTDKTRQERISFIFNKSVKKITKNTKSYLTSSRYLQMDSLMNKLNSIAPKTNHESAYLSFSLDPNSCVKEEWIIYPDEYKDPERHTILELARQRLKSAIKSKRSIHLHNQKSFSDGPLEIRYYREHNTMALMKPSTKENVNLVNSSPFSSNILHSLQKEYLPYTPISNNYRKLLLKLPDCTTIWQYPSGNIALVASRKFRLEKTLYYHIFDDTKSSCMLASFLPNCRGICYYRNGNIGILYDVIGGKKFNQNSWIERVWTWPNSNLKLSSSVSFTLNQYIRFTCISQSNVNVTFSCNGESIKLNFGYEQIETDRVTNSRQESPLTLQSLPVVLRDNKKSNDINDSFEVLDNKSLYEDIDRLKIKIMKLVNDWLNSYITTIKLKNSTQASEFAVFLENNSNQKNSSPIFWEYSKTFFGNFGKSLPSSREQSRCSKQSTRTRPHLYNDNKTIDVHSKNKIKIALSLSLNDSNELKFFQVDNIDMKKSFKINFPLMEIFDNRKLISKSICVSTLRNYILSKSLNFGNICSCNRTVKRKISYITDVEYDVYITHMAPINQITVVCIFSSKILHSLIAEDVINALHYNKNKYKFNPCLESSSDTYRIFKYDLANCTNIDNIGIPLLVERHKVEPGMFLMYWRAKLIFANFIFNGYGNESKDFSNQIKHAIRLGHGRKYLPDHFKFSPISNRNYINRIYINRFESTVMDHEDKSLGENYSFDLLFN